MTSRLENLYRDALRRRLVQTGALYIAVAWGGTEILAFLIDALWDEATAQVWKRYLAILLIAGFPAAMYLAWTRDLGLKARRLFSAGALVVMIVAVLVMTIEPPDPDILQIDENSIAVLPFEVCEGRSSDALLAAGLTADVHRRLAGREGFSVKSWISVKTVAESSPSIARMAGLLGARYFVQGIVCREGPSPVLHAELTDNKGTTVWRGDFRRVVNEYDQVVQQMSTLVDNEIAKELGDVRTVVEDEAVEREALMQFQIGQGWAREENWERARQCFEQALDIKPDYAEAWYWLAMVTNAASVSANNVVDAKKDAVPIAQTALAIAREAAWSNPRDFEAHKAAGLILATLAKWTAGVAATQFESIGEEGVRKELDKAQSMVAEAEQYLRTALHHGPDDTYVRSILAEVLDTQGIDKRKESKNILEKGLVSDPWNVRLVERVSYRLLEFGEVRKAMDLLDGFNQLAQGKPHRIRYIQLENLNNYNLIDEKLAYLIEFLNSEPEVVGEGYLSHLWWTAANIANVGLYEEAEKYYQQVAALPLLENTGWRQYFLHDMYSWATGNRKEPFRRRLDKVAGLSNSDILKASWNEAGLVAVSFFELGERDRAIELMEAIALHPMSKTRWPERQTLLAQMLAGWYLQVGRGKEAMPILADAAAHLQAEVDAGVRHPETLRRLADAYGLQGNSAAALATLDTAVDYDLYDPRMCCQEYLYNGFEVPEELAWWKDLEGNADFELIRSRMRSMIDAQRSNIRALLQQHDMQQLLAPLVDAEVIDE